jgi:hypothetical protein
LVSFASFKDKIIKFRKKVEEWKDNHKMASQAVSAVIDSLPQPFDKFFGIVWNGLEKQDRADSAQKLIALIEKFESINEQSFTAIISKLDQLLESQISDEDIRELGDKIQMSKEDILIVISENTEKLVTEIRDTRTKTVEDIKQLIENARKPIEPRINLIDLQIDGELRYTDAKELRFVLVNNGTGTAIVKSMRLAILNCGMNTELKSLEIAAPLQVYEYSVNLEPNVMEYEIISPLFTKKRPSFYLKAGEADSFLVNLTSQKAYWYEFEIRIEWMDTAGSTMNIVESPKLRVEYSILL